jgi:ligand-binding sensor domain-containing protein
MSFRPLLAAALALAACFLLSALPLPSQERYNASRGLDSRKDLFDYIHEAWSKDQGLPQVSVESLCQTRDGYLWLATQEGLARFDGSRFQVFNRTTFGLPSIDLTAVVEDRQGRLWMGSRTSGVFWIENGKVHILNTSNGLSDNIITSGHSSLVVDSAGTVWAAMQNGGVNGIRNGKVITTKLFNIFGI